MVESGIPSAADWCMAEITGKISEASWLHAAGVPVPSVPRELVIDAAPPENWPQGKPVRVYCAGSETAEVGDVVEVTAVWKKPSDEEAVRPFFGAQGNWLAIKSRFSGQTFD